LILGGLADFNLGHTCCRQFAYLTNRCKLIVLKILDWR
jgi:hypothetical protein